MALTGTKALMVWCQQVTNGYKDVKISNMTSAWRDGLAFCAILNHYRPDLLNFDKLSKENIAENNHLAFTTAEDELGIPALLDVDDMVEMAVPDRLSIMTYISQYFSYFKDKVPGDIPPPTRQASKRQSPFTTDDLPKKKTAPGFSAVKEVIGASPTPKLNKGTVDRFCAKCRETVYLMERFQVEGKLFHRVCFKCDTCGVQLRMGTYRYIPTEELFYCDMHYRKRTTSTSSDELRMSQRNDSQKGEKDALQSLLHSLENKRKVSEKSQEDQDPLQSSSLHTRVGNARKVFMQTDQPEVAHASYMSEGVNDGNKTSPLQPRAKQPPLRPSTPPKLDSKDDKVKDKVLGKAKVRTQVDSKSSEHIPSRPISPPSKKLHRSSDDLPIRQHSPKEHPATGSLSEATDSEAPPRPPSGPQHHQLNHSEVSNEKHMPSSESNRTNIANARGFLTHVLPKQPSVEGEDSPSRPVLRNTEEKGGIHIYEKPFAGIVSEDVVSGGFENPRYGDSINIEPPVVYGNEGSSLLSLEHEKKEKLKNPTIEEIKTDYGNAAVSTEDVNRPRTDSSCSEGARKKKLVLKVKKKKKKDDDVKERGFSVNLDEQTAEQIAVKNTEVTEKGDEKANDAVTSPEPKSEASVEEKVDDSSQEGKIDVQEDNEMKLVDTKENMSEESLESIKSEEKDVESKITDTELEINDHEMNNHEIKDNEIKDHEIKDHEIKDTEIKDNKIKDREIKDHEMNNHEIKDTEIKDNKIKDTEIKDREINDYEPIIDVQNVPPSDDEQQKSVEAVEENIKKEVSLKVVKYVNPFEDSDDEILNDEHVEKKALKPKVILNPFEVMSDEDEGKEGDAEKHTNGIVSAQRITPGEGPKIPVSPKEIEEHQKKIADIKKGLLGTGEKADKYRNPFEDSDDDLLNDDLNEHLLTGDNHTAQGNSQLPRDNGRKKMLVLKTNKKKKRPAPRKPDAVEAPLNLEADMADPMPPLPNETADDNDKAQTTTVNDTSEEDIIDDNLLETFTTYVKNSSIELDKDKRLESRPIERRNGSIGKRVRADSGMTSPVSASCPSLLDDDHPDPTSIGVDHDRPVSTEDMTIQNSVSASPERIHGSEVGYVPEKDLSDDQHRVEDGNVGSRDGGTTESPVTKKEKPPKRPAPPVPKGIQPYREEQRKNGPLIIKKPNGQSKVKEDVEKKEEKKKNDKKKDEKKKDEKKDGKSKDEKVKEDDKKDEKKKDEKKDGKKKEEKKVGKKSVAAVIPDKPKNKPKEKPTKAKKKEEKTKIPNDKRTVSTTERKVETEDPDIYFIEEKEFTSEEIATELKFIESKQRELERKGVQMEKKLREQLHGEPEDNYMVTWFDLVTEKNKLLRRENELIYMSQEMEFHENQRRIEFELRLLMAKDDSAKTEEDRTAEEQLLEQLVNYVARRNKIVEKMEEDRLREKEEDQQIQMVMMAQGLTRSKKKKSGKRNSTAATFYE